MPQNIPTEFPFPIIIKIVPSEHKEKSWLKKTGDGSEQNNEAWSPSQGKEYSHDVRQSCAHARCPSHVCSCPNNKSYRYSGSWQPQQHQHQQHLGQEKVFDDGHHLFWIERNGVCCTWFRSDCS